ncbi:prepilin-type N-terminal cleavage/methylation domain-containing protein [Deinococcus sp. QL22]|uniref:prepilin-type N-terminal cleavage/methylation domain-containing protein n=1 Tax=Deinococcus sp. QL22 TaxID=2939437 RepID=UPI00201721EB|nr:prepilin-type N-terminal cleavage/methylation domain-containing protein [Deinococcus sp. QL22]UQN08517.1 prepilin-type N-terminal cleavage/methylation domain-containing protein [Deinococcus sp. QL22]
MTSQRFSRPTTQTQGFTLIELLIVIAIIAVLAAILIPTFAGAQKKPFDVAAAQCGRAIVTAQVVFKAEGSGYVAPVASMGEDVREACTAQNVQVSPDSSPANNPGAGVGNNINAGSDNFAFQVFHPSGTGFLMYNKNDGTNVSGTRLNRVFKW